MSRREHYAATIAEVVARNRGWIERFRARELRDHGAAYAANCGLCEEVANELERRFDAHGWALSTDHAAINPSWAPYQLTEAEVGHMERMSHSWWFDPEMGLHFDAEAPQGVSDWRRLPLFARVLAPGPSGGANQALALSSKQETSMPPVYPFVGTGKSRHIQTPRPTLRRRRQWGPQMFALPFDQASPSTRTRMQAEYPGAAGAFPMDTMARTVNARSRAISELNAGRITVADARTIFARTQQRAAQMAGRAGWHALAPRVIEKTGQGWRSKAPTAARPSQRRRGAANMRTGRVSYGADSSFPARYDRYDRWNGFLASPLFEEAVVRQIVAELNAVNPPESRLTFRGNQILEEGHVVGERQPDGWWSLGSHAWTWVEDCLCGTPDPCPTHEWAACQSCGMTTAFEDALSVGQLEHVCPDCFSNLTGSFQDGAQVRGKANRWSAARVNWSAGQVGPTRSSVKAAARDLEAAVTRGDQYVEKAFIEVRDAMTGDWVRLPSRGRGRANCGCGGPCCGGKSKKKGGRANCGCRGRKNVPATHITDIGPICTHCEGNDGLWGYGLGPKDMARATCPTCHHVEDFPSPEGTFVTASALREAHHKTRGRAPVSGEANIYYDVASWYGGQANAAPARFAVVFLGRRGQILGTRPASSLERAAALVAAGADQKAVHKTEVYDGGALHGAWNRRMARQLKAQLGR